MDEWFSSIAANAELSGEAAQELLDTGFVVIPGFLLSERLTQVCDAYDAVFSGATADEVHKGSTSTRISDFINRGPEFDELYVHETILAACCRTIRQPFKLSTMHARTVIPHASPQALHVDFPRDDRGWPMVGFIIMLDEFHGENGSTRFVPGSHNWSTCPGDTMKDLTADHESQLLARGPAGSVIIYNGSVWHGHAANQTSEPRRSLQGAYIRRDAERKLDLAARMRPDTLARLDSMTRYLLDI
jgi:ectoine hydroxylase-related dioxygenase (phytanoyl-CoA dioxygenase family)